MSPVQHKPILHGRDHCPGGADPIPCFPDPRGTDIEGRILALGPDAFWKLNEASGPVAHDSSGNEHDLEGGPPAWLSDVGPPGETSARWYAHETAIRMASSPGEELADFTTDFTAGVWVYVHDISPFPQEILGQGAPFHAEPGWALMMVDPGASPTFCVVVNGLPAYANAFVAAESWYFLAAVNDAGLWKLYVDGILQEGSHSEDPGDGYGDNTWLGSDDWPAHTTWLRDTSLSYAFIVNTPLTSTELIEIAEGGSEATAGIPWVKDGAGGAHWGQVSTEGIAPGTDGYWLKTEAGAVVWAPAPTGGGTSSTDTAGWLPLTTVTGGVPDLVWDADNDLIPTYGPF